MCIIILLSIADCVYTPPPTHASCELYVWVYVSWWPSFVGEPGDLFALCLPYTKASRVAPVESLSKPNIHYQPGLLLVFVSMCLSGKGRSKFVEILVWIFTVCVCVCVPTVCASVYTPLHPHWEMFFMSPSKNIGHSVKYACVWAWWEGAVNPNTVLNGELGYRPAVLY